MKMEVLGCFLPCIVFVTLLTVPTVKCQNIIPELTCQDITNVKKSDLIQKIDNIQEQYNVDMTKIGQILKAEVAELRREYNADTVQLKKKLNDTNKKLDAVEKNRAEVAQLKREYNAEIEPLKKELNDTKNKLDAVEKSRSAVAQLKRKYNAEIELLKRELNDTNKKLDAVEKNRAEVSSLKREHNAEIELLKKELNDTKTKLDAEIKNTAEIAQLKRKYNTETELLKRELNDTKNKLDAVEKNRDEIAQLKREYNTETELLKRELNDTKKKLDAVEKNRGMKARKSKISFSAGLSSSKKSLSSGETIIYQHVISNTGNAYNAATGIFTSPKEGTYVFYFSTYPWNAGYYLYLDIVHNGNTVVRGRLIDKFYSDAVSNLAVIRLTAGDRVWIRCYDGCDAGIWNLETSYASTFSGFML